MRFGRKKGADTPQDERVEGYSEEQDTTAAGTSESARPDFEAAELPPEEDAAGLPPEEATPQDTGVHRRSIHDRAGSSAGQSEGEQQEPAAAASDAAGPDTTHEASDPPEPDPGATAETTVLDSSTPADSEPEGRIDDSQGTDTAAGAMTAKKKRKKKRGRKVAIGAGIVVLVLAGAYAGAAWFLGDRVPADTTVAGVDVSGLSIPDAEAVLEEELGALEETALALTFADVTAEIQPGEAGLTFDAEATVARFTGFALHPQVLFGHIFGLGQQPAISTVDEDQLTESLQTLSGDLDVSPVEGAITLAEGEAEVTEPEDGAAVDVEAAVEVIGEEWIEAQEPIEVPAEVVEPEIGPDQVQAAMDDIVDPLLSGPVIVDVNDTEIELTVTELTDAAELPAEGGELVLELDGQELAETVTDKEDSVGEAPQDAQIVLEGGEPTIIPAVTGTGLDPEELGEAVEEAAVVTDSDSRIASLELTQTEAEFSTEDAEALGVVEQISSYSTPMPYDPPRTENLVVGTERINGTLVLPGEEFSLLEALGPITVANGYPLSGVVVDGFFTQAAGGGLSQLSTTTFNAGFEAGMEDVTHQPHSRWFDRYPEGREATLYEPDLDMIWRNNTDYGVLIQSWVADSRTHVVLWGTDVWDVQITTSDRYNITQPQTLYNDNPQCEAESGGQNGFTVDYRRTVSSGGEVQEERSYSHTYRPWNRVICGSPPSDSDEDNGSDDDDDNGDGDNGDGDGDSDDGDNGDD